MFKKTEGERTNMDLETFATAFNIGLGMALVKETYEPPVREAIFRPTEQAMRERRQFIERVYKESEAENTKLTVKEVYSHVKEYFIAFRDDFQNNPQPSSS
ncbi:unnamed protein product [marine sediment metagenome]|uniref:Uncharacterized protein n=1 Tax=marine sediment metagenome TaxID=412755 RepID=X1TC93_9ZZZZ